MGELNDQKTRLELATWRASGGDAAARAELRSFLDDTPALWEEFAALTREAVDRWRSVITERHGIGADPLVKDVAEWTQQLLESASTPIQRSLVEALHVCQLGGIDAEHVEETTHASERLRLKRLHSTYRRIRSLDRLLDQVRSMAFMETNPGIAMDSLSDHSMQTFAG